MKTVVKQNPDNEIPVEILAENIQAISNGFKKIREGRLNNRAILLLVSTWLHYASDGDSRAVFYGQG